MVHFLQLSLKKPYLINLNQLLKLNSEIVRLNLKTDQQNSIDICGLYRTNNQKNIKDKYQFYYSNQHDYCNHVTFDGSDNQTLDSYGVVVKISSNCSYNDVFSLIQLDEAGIAIIGSDGPIVSLFYL